MKVRILLFLLASLMFLNAQNVFLWDRDGDNTIMNPEDPWQFIGVEEHIENALIANGITPTVDYFLPDDLSSYDMIFATVGIWCSG